MATMLQPCRAAWTMSNVRHLSTTLAALHIMKLTRCKVVDNSALGREAEADGKPARCIHVYTRSGVGTLGDKILVAIKGQKKKAVIVGVKKAQKSMRPRHDSNNIVLLDANGNPMGTRILAPIPSLLRRKPEYSKLISIASTFV